MPGAYSDPEVIRGGDVYVIWGWISRRWMWGLAVTSLAQGFPDEVRRQYILILKNDVLPYYTGKYKDYKMLFWDI